MKKTILSVCGACLAALMMSSCDGAFGVDGNANGPLDPVLDQRMENVVPDHIALKLMHSMPLYKGLTPPIVNGSYRSTPMQLVYDEYLAWPFFLPGNDLYLWFRGQDATKNTLNYTSKLVSDWRIEKDEVRIAGEGNNFTIFFPYTITVQDNYGNDVDLDLGVVMSGTKIPGALKDLYWGFVILGESIPWTPGCGLLPEGGTRVFKDGNTISPTDMTWP